MQLTKKSMVAGLAAVSMSLVSLAASASHVLDAEMRSSDIRMPSQMKAGQKYDVVVKVKNVGSMKWQGRDFQMLSKITRSPSGAPAQRDEFTPHVYLKDSVQTDAKTEFHYKVQAPTWTGNWELTMSMAKGSSRFGDIVKKSVRVVGD
tara:strand:+ start:132 stop:575 length:444 start_codon:yes stop_codon:yes gene_type:complete